MSKKQTEMESILQKYLRDMRNKMGQVPYIKTASGLELSIQASEMHYCEPRNNRGPWTKVEIGFPNRYIEELIKYADDPETPTGTVYGYVPIKLAAKIILDNGGFE